MKGGAERAPIPHVRAERRQWLVSWAAKLVGSIETSPVVVKIVVKSSGAGALALESYLIGA